MNRPLAPALGVLLALYCISLFLAVADSRSPFQWDFKAYYYAAQAYAGGLNPYDHAVLTRLAHGWVYVKFIYLPLALALFRPFTLLSYPEAYILYLFLKCCAAVALVLFWKRCFIRRDAGIPFYLFCLLGFNGALYIDIKAGNISVPEQLVLWCAFYAFVSGRPGLFCLGVVAVAAIKISPLLFLALLPFCGDEGWRPRLAWSIALFAAIMAMNYLAAPALFGDFLRCAAEVNDRGGIVNPSTLWFMRDSLEIAARGSGLEPLRDLTLPLYWTAVGAVVWVTGRALVALKRRGMGGKEVEAVCLACLAYALVMPRFKDYSYVVLLVPAYLVMARMRNVGAHALIFLAAMVPSPATGSYYVLPWYGLVFHRLIWPYYPLLLAWVIWGACLREVFRAVQIAQP